MKMRKIAALLAAALTVTSLFGCGQQTNTPAASESKPAQTSESTVTSESVVENKLPYEGVVVKALANGGAGTLTDKTMDAINAILSEKLGCTIEVELIADYQQYNLALSSGDVYDLCFCADWLNFWDNARTGAYLEITDEELQTYVPYIWENYQEDSYLPSIDGVRYAVVNGKLDTTMASYAFRGDLLEKYGMADADLTKMENIEAFLAAVKENEADMIPYDTPGTDFWNLLARYYADWGWRSVGTLSFGEHVYYDVDDPEHKIFIAAEQPEVLELTKTYQRWYENGYFSQSVLSNTTKMLDSFKAGRSAMVRLGSTSDIESLMTEVNGDERAAWNVKIVPYYTENGTTYSARTKNLTGIPHAAKNKEAALSVLNEIYTNKELYDLVVYGLPETYTIDENGAITINVEQADTGWMKLGINRTDFEYSSALTDPQAIAVKEYYDENTSSTPGTSCPINTDSVANIVTALTEVRNQYTIPRVYGVFEGSAEDMLAAEVKALKDAGIDEYVACLQEQLDAFWPAE